MTPSSPDAHRAEFSVRCACGIEYHTSDTHIGKVLPCKCGRKVEIIRPPADKTRDGSRSSANSPGDRKLRRRKITRRQTIPGFWSSRLGAPGRYLDALNATTARWFAAQLEPFYFGSVMARLTALMSWLFLFGVIGAWALMYFFSERTIPGSIIAYGPRFLALWPLAILVPIALIFARRTLWPLAIAAVIIVFPIMGFQISPSTIGRTPPAQPAAGTFRVITYNVQSGNALSSTLGMFLKDQAPDVFTFQECNNRLWEAIQKLDDWYSQRYGGLCTGSRWKIETVDVMTHEDFGNTSGSGGGLVMRAFITTPRGPLVVVNVHFETARRGLEGMLGKEGLIPDNNPFNREIDAREGNTQRAEITGENRERFRRNAAVRNAESMRASQWAVGGLQGTPLIIAGDFNLPVESTIFRKYWRDFVDAFETRGNGLGWTKREGRWLRIRIDHILSIRGGLDPQTVEVGPDYESDHLPLIADYAWPANVAPKR